MSDKVGDEDFSYIQAQVRRFIRNDVVPRENEIMAADRIPDDLRAAAAQMGLFGYAIPAEWGGLGLDLRQDVELEIEFGYTTLALRSMFGTNNGIAGQVLVSFGTEAQKKQWLERIASGEVVTSFALTEPGAGSNPAGLRTSARRDGAGWVLDGQKRFITNAPLADLFVVFARTREPGPGGPGIAVFLVPANTAGVSVGPKDAKMGQEGAWTADVILDSVRVGESALVGGAEEIGYRAAMASWPAAGCTSPRSRSAAPSGPWTSRWPTPRPAPRAESRSGNTSSCRRCSPTSTPASPRAAPWSARLRPPTTAAPTALAPSAAKLFCTEMAGRVADLAVQVHGGSGYMREVPVERIYRDVRLLRLYEGTSEIQRLIIGGGLIRDQQRASRAGTPA